MMRHLGVLVRGLVGIPLLVFAEPFADRVVRRIVGNFLPSGVVRTEDAPSFLALLRRIERWRDSWIPWLVMIGLALLSAITSTQRPDLMDPDTLTWGLNSTGGLEFGTRWALYVVRPLFLFYSLVWLWRLTLCWLLFRGVSRFDLRLVPSHPDKAGGLGFIEGLPIAFSMVSLSLSSVFCAYVAHQIRSHGARFQDFQSVLIALGIVLVAMFGAPLLAFAKPLRRARILARFQYGTLAARHVQGVHARWVEGKPVEEEAILSAPELGPACDVGTLYDMGTGMRSVPLSRSTLVSLLWPVLLPMLLVYSMEVPLKDILLKVLGALT
jgi:hypothetical protein